MAVMMLSVALSIDMVLPGLSHIGEALHKNNTDLQGIITMIFLGLGIGQLFFGPLSDSFGRKPIVYAGIAIFLIASWICVKAENLEMMLFGRMVQGLGLSGPRSVLISIIRDLYEGDYMGRIMSFITVIFILVPMLAPILGQLIIDHFHWQGVFYFQMFFVIVMLLWFGIRQEETLLSSKRIQLNHHLYINGTKEFFKYNESVIYTLISGLTLGSFMVFLSSSQQIFQVQFGMVKEYAYIFAGLSFWAGFATFVNGMLVLRFGMQRLAKLAIYLFSFNALTYAVLFFSSANPNLWVVLGFMSIQFIAFGFIYGNAVSYTHLTLPTNREV